MGFNSGFKGLNKFHTEDTNITCRCTKSSHWSNLVPEIQAPKSKDYRHLQMINTH